MTPKWPKYYSVIYSIFNSLFILLSYLAPFLAFSSGLLLSRRATNPQLSSQWSACQCEIEMRGTISCPWLSTHLECPCLGTFSGSLLRRNVLAWSCKKMPLKIQSAKTWYAPQPPHLQPPLAINRASPSRHWLKDAHQDMLTDCHVGNKVCVFVGGHGWAARPTQVCVTATNEVFQQLIFSVSRLSDVFTHQSFSKDSGRLDSIQFEHKSAVPQYCRPSPKANWKVGLKGASDSGLWVSASIHCRETRQWQKRDPGMGRRS